MAQSTHNAGEQRLQTGLQTAGHYFTCNGKLQSIGKAINQASKNPMIDHPTIYAIRTAIMRTYYRSLADRRSLSLRMQTRLRSLARSAAKWLLMHLTSLCERVIIQLAVVARECSRLGSENLKAYPKRGLTLSGEAKKSMKSTRLQRVRPLFGKALRSKCNLTSRTY